MESHMTTREIWWAVLTIPGVALLCLLFFAKLHWLSNSVPFAVIGALVAGFVVWWIGRRWFTLTYAIVIALIFVFLEAFIDPPGTSAETNKKMTRRQKLEKAIARREALLRSMDDEAKT
jgi:hypothetical protein